MMKDISLVFLIFLLIFIFLNILLIVNLEKYKRKIRAQALEIHMHELYGGCNQDLVESIRRKQHDYNNHLFALTGMHHMISTYEELVEAQNTYCASLKEDKSDYPLLSHLHPMLSGLLYAKGVCARAENIQLTYDVSLSFRKSNVPDYILVYCTGILFDAVLEASRENHSNQMELCIHEA